MRLLFQLGREPLISTAEIEAVFSLWGVETQKIPVASPYLIYECTKEIEAAVLMERLGGTVLIAEALLSAGDAKQTIIEHLITHQPDGKIHFSLQGKNAPELAKEIKKELVEAGRNVRYIRPGNTATILHNNLVERSGNILILDHGIFTTKAIQPIEDWGARDFGRPSRDDKSGMLPPKLARILVNLAGVKENAALLDPFCGSGTILMEALLLGYTKIMGTDASERAIEDTKANIAWLKEKYTFSGTSIKVAQSDVRQLAKQTKLDPLDAIITEPFLGTPLRGNESKIFLQNQARELAGLYSDSFRAFSQILKPNSVVVWVLPIFQNESEWIQVPCLDAIKKAGFVPVPLLPNHTSLRYHRPGQRVAREIWRFERGV